MAAAALALVLLALGSQPPVLPTVDLAGLPPATANALRPLWDAAQSRPVDAATVGRLAITLHAWEQWDAAATSYARTRALTPADPKWWYLSGLLEASRGRHQDAVPLFARAVELAPADAVAKLRLAEAQLEAGDLKSSGPIFTELATRGELAAAAEYGLGRIAAAQGRHEGAIVHFARAVERFPDFGAAHYAMALSRRRLKQTADAHRSIERQQACLACWPATPDPLAAMVRDARDDPPAQLARGIALAREGQIEPAIARHVEVVKQAPRFAQAHVNLIALYGRAGRWSEAESHYRAAVEGDANQADAHANFGEVLLAQRRYADAAAAFKLAVAITPHYASARNGLGTALEGSGDRVGALAAYRQAVTDAPTLRVARFNYARLLMAAGQLPEATAELERIQGPEDAETPRYRFALSAALVRSGQIARGRTIAQSALELARRFNQTELAATIERDLAKLR